MTVRTHNDARHNFAPSATGTGDRTVLGWVVSTATALWHAVEDLNQRIQNWRGVEAMLKLDDALLRDMGVTRGEIIRASRLPLSHRAGEELSRVSRRRARGLDD